MPTKTWTRRKTHGLSMVEGKATRLYGIWCGMKQRCYNPKSCNYKYYGGRGIAVCDEWQNDYKAFYDWAMSNGYCSNLSIDRINVNGNYEPSNCQWVTQSYQILNRRTRADNKTGIRRVYFENQTQKYRAEICTNGRRFRSKRFDTPEEAIKSLQEVTA